MVMALSIAKLRRGRGLFEIAVLALPVIQSCSHEDELAGIRMDVEVAAACASSMRPYWYDADGDGHSPDWFEQPELACSPPISAPEGCDAKQGKCEVNWSATPLQSDDCDDGNAYLHPGAPEITVVDAGPTSSATFSTMALHLNGVNEYVNLGNLTFETGSISMWLRTGSNGPLFTKQAPERHVGELEVSIKAGRLDLKLTQPDIGPAYIQSKSADTLLTDNRWHHVAATFNPGMEVFVDGVSHRARKENAAGMTFEGANAELGRRNEAQMDEFFEGLIDEVAIFDHVLDPAEVERVYNGGTPGDLSKLGAELEPRHWWRMGEDGTLSTAFDSAGSANGQLVTIDASNFESVTVSTNTGCLPD